MFSNKVDTLLNLLNLHKDSITYSNGSYEISNTLKTSFSDASIDLIEKDEIIKVDFKKYLSLNKTFCIEDIKSISYDSIEKDFGVISLEKNFVKFDASTFDISSYGDKGKEFIESVINKVYYYKLYNKLKVEPFCDHHHDAKREIIFYNAANGIFKLQYDTISPIFNFNIQENCNKILNYLEGNHYVPFIKNSLFLFSEKTNGISLQNFILNAPKIIENSLRDYDLVIKQFDFETFKDSLFKEKEKFFSSIREILNKIFAQAIGIPISITATIFTTYKAEEESLTLVLILVSFLVYVALYIYIQLVYLSDLKDLDSDFNSQFEIIATKSGLPPNAIQVEKNKILKKLSNTKILSRVLIGIMTILGLTVICFIWAQIVGATLGEVFLNIVSFFASKKD